MRSSRFKYSCFHFWQWFVFELNYLLQVPETPFTFQFAHKVSVTDCCSLSIIFDWTKKKSFYMKKWWFVSTPIYQFLYCSSKIYFLPVLFKVLDIFPIFSSILSFVIPFWYIFSKVSFHYDLKLRNKLQELST